MGRKRGRAGDFDLASKGEEWRGMMRGECESVPALIWKRVFRRFKIDLSRPADATGLQIFRLLSPVMERGDLPLTASVLIEEIDMRVERVFGKRD